MLAQKSNKKGAMEMSVGTIVTIVLLMSVLVLGIFLVQKIFSTGTNAIDQVDDQVQQQISELFADGDKKIVTFPQARKVSIEKGQSSGFAFSITNQVEGESKTFSYEVIATDNSCGMSTDEAENLISLGGSGEQIGLDSGSSMDQPAFVRLQISEDDPLCTIRYRINVQDSEGSNYATATKDVEIVSGSGLF